MPGKATVFVQIHQKLVLAHITTATKKIPVSSYASSNLDILRKNRESNSPTPHNQ